MIYVPFLHVLYRQNGYGELCAINQSWEVCYTACTTFRIIALKRWQLCCLAWKPCDKLQWVKCVLTQCYCRSLWCYKLVHRRLVCALQQSRPSILLPFGRRQHTTFKPLCACAILLQFSGVLHVLELDEVWPQSTAFVLKKDYPVHCWWSESISAIVNFSGKTILEARKQNVYQDHVTYTPCLLYKIAVLLSIYISFYFDHQWQKKKLQAP